MSKHTPGPWTAKTKTTRFAVTSQHLTVAHVIGLDAAAKADARLIAAAPDLLEALKEMVEGDAEAIAEAEALGVPFPEEMLTAYRRAVAAIAKAEDKS